MRMFSWIWRMDLHPADCKASDPRQPVQTQPLRPLAGPVSAAPPDQLQLPRTSHSGGRAEDMGSTGSGHSEQRPQPGRITLVGEHAREGSPRCHTSKNKQVSGAPPAAGSSGNTNPPENIKFPPTEQSLTQARTPCRCAFTGCRVYFCGAEAVGRN